MDNRIDTRPVVAGSSQATHWTCPQAPTGGTEDNTTHKLRYPTNTCVYCGVSRAQLQERHEQILETVNRRIKEGLLSPAARSMSVRDILRQYAEANALTLEEADIELGITPGWAH